MDFFPDGGSGGTAAPGMTVQNVPGSSSSSSSGSVFSVKYYRQKVDEFQQMLYALQGAQEAVLGLIDYGPQEMRPEFLQLLNELDLKIGRFKFTAEALNLGINGINRDGGNFPTLKIPAGLGVAPAVIAAGIGATVAVAAGLIAWGSGWIKAVIDVVKRAQVMGYMTPEQRAALAPELAKLDQAQSASELSPLTSIATIVKWAAIAAVVYYGYQAYQRSR
jgi:hypothetical protein